jgi:hypothetical protein
MSVILSIFMTIYLRRENARRDAEYKRPSEYSEAEKEAERERAKESLRKGGATEEQISLYEAAPQGGQSKIIENIVEEKSRQSAPVGTVPESLVDYDKGLTPKERVKRQDARYAV